MTKIRVNDLLKHATRNRYGVPAINVLNFESIKFAIKAAELEGVPIIIQYYPGFASHMPLNQVAYIASDLAEKASVPVAVHLDHSNSFDIALSGIRDGFPSVMVDGSALPFEENVALTKDVVDVARVSGVDIEAELGHVGSGLNLEDFEDTHFYTRVDQAIEFVERTGCDSLAVAVGNAHGPYIKEPKLDFKRISELREALSIPLVLHGGSGIPDDQMQKAVELGMSKVNVATEYFNVMYQAIQEESKKSQNIVEIMMKIEKPMVDFVRKKLLLLNPERKTL